MPDGGMSPEIAVAEPAVVFSERLNKPVVNKDQLNGLLDKALSQLRGKNIRTWATVSTAMLLFLSACGVNADANSVNEKAAALLAGGDRSAETSGTEAEMHSKDPIGKAEFGNGVSAAEALKQAIAGYQKVLNPKWSDEEARQAAEGAYNEVDATSSCPTCNVVVKDENGVYMTNHWKGMYDYVNDGDPSTFVSDEINNTFSGSGEIYYFFDFSEAKSLMQGLQGQHLPTRFDMMGNDGHVQTLWNEAAYAEPGVVFSSP